MSVMLLDSALLRGNPVAAINKSRRFVSASRGQPLLFTPSRPEKHWSENGGREAGYDRKLLFHLAPQFADLLAAVTVDFSEFALHHPQRHVVGASQLFHTARKALAHAHIGIIFVTLPALQHGAAHAVKARTIALEIAPEGPIQKSFGVVTRDRLVLKIKFVLPVNIGEVDLIQHASLRGHLLIKRGSGDWRIEHELVKISLAANCSFDLRDDVVGRMVLESDDR